MDRVDLYKPIDIENMIYHLIRYKFVARTINKNDTIIELGCGNGYGAYFLSEYCQSIEAYDIDPEVIKYAKEKYKRGNIKYYNKDLIKEVNKNINRDSKKSFPQADVIICFEVIEHMTREDAMIAINTLKLLRKRNGIVFLSTPKWVPDVQKTQNRIKHHIHEYTYEELKKDLLSIFNRVIILGQLDEIIGSLNKDNVWTYFCVCW
ncbi:MAG: class I SAM-dependent methyltransferase [Methanomassiliicoccales archaeon]|nr:MAG: class I SAM-dependent methyltransferase [Methanomassiliicoccales archaeon]